MQSKRDAAVLESDTNAWENVAPWLQSRLTAQPLAYKSLLPVQHVVVPFLTRAIASGIAMDACISAPTGSGKTLCYLLPMLSMIAQRKAVSGATELQAIILVPTKALAMQVHHVILSLTAAARRARKRKGAKKEEGAERSAAADAAEPGSDDEPQEADGDVAESAELKDDGFSKIRSVVVCGGMTPREESASLVRVVRLPRAVQDPAVTSSFFSSQWPSAALDAAEPIADLSAAGEADDGDEEFFFSLADVLIATPQRVLKHLGSTPGFTLRHLRMLIVDEADEILSGSFSNFAGTIVHYFEEEQVKMLQGAAKHGAAADLPNVLHKVLCSATMTTHLARVSEIRLRNSKVFSLDSLGAAVNDDGAVERTDGAIKARVSTQFHLPPNLKEHQLVVRDDQRHVVLLHLVRQLQSGHSPTNPGTGTDPAAAAAAAASASLIAPKTSNGILIFCATADTARVVGKFLTLGGIPALEFTSLATELERRKALICGVSGVRREVIVTTDALMRGVDMPGVRHVVMYDPPRSLQQYVHRAGRTARALSEGCSYVLLSKYGPSQTLVDGEVAHFKALDGLLKRATPLVYAKGMQATTPAMLEEANALLARTQKALKTAVNRGTLPSGDKEKAPAGEVSGPRKRLRNA